MTALETITAKAQEKGLRFLVIGGHAVMAHGFARSTYDLDLLVRANEREQWLQLLKEAGATVHSSGKSFIQFQPTTVFPETADLMLVNDQTFEQFWIDSIVPVPPDSYGETRFVSLNHLIALKCHAIKHGHAGRVEKDVDDILELVKINKVDIADEKFRQLILKHGLPELYDKIKRVLGQ